MKLARSIICGRLFTLKVIKEENDLNCLFEEKAIHSRCVVALIVVSKILLTKLYLRYSCVSYYFTEQRLLPPVIKKHIIIPDTGGIIAQWKLYSVGKTRHMSKSY